MSEPLPSPPVSLNQARERTIELLSQHFAEDDLPLDQLEERLELVYRAKSIPELEALLADLRPGNASPLAPTERPAAKSVSLTPAARGKIRSLFSETKRDGIWAAPERLDVSSMFSDTTIDFTRATLPVGALDVHVKALCTSLKFIVPPGIRVITDLGAMFSSVGGAEDTMPLDESEPAARTVIRITGWATMSEVKVAVRRKELTADNG